MGCPGLEGVVHVSQVQVHAGQEGPHCRQQLWQPFGAEPELQWSVLGFRV